jgi:hypothetical protein
MKSAGSHLNGHNFNRIGDALEEPRADRPEAERSAFGQVTDKPCSEDFAALGERGHSGGDCDRMTVEVVHVANDIPRMQPHS